VRPRSYARFKWSPASTNESTALAWSILLSFRTDIDL
jgi:hypothetical protein